jgi:hypothetical protein
MPTGKITTYDLTVGVIVDIEDMFHSLDPYETPIIGMYGADGRSAIAKGTCFEKKVEWLDETLLTPRSTLNGALLINATSVVIATADANKFGVGDVIRIGGELKRVTAVAGDGVTLTVTASFGGSTSTAHSDGADVVGVGLALAEGSDPEAARSVDRTNVYNYTQIFGPHKVHVSATENVVRKYGLRGTEFDYQAASRTKEVAVSIEQAVQYGLRYEDSGTKIRTMGGMINFITTNVDSSTTTITDTTLLDMLEDIYRAGGNPDRAVLGPKQKRVISAFDSADIQLSRTDNGRGQTVDYFDSDFSRITLLMNRWTRDSDLFIFQRDQAELTTLRPLSFEMLAKTGDAISGQIVTEKTFKFRKQKHAGRFSALT